MVKAELWQLVKLHIPPVQYRVDELAEAQGFEVLRLPPYHCDLNPIELVWARMKNRVARFNTTFKLADVRKLTEDSVRVITAADWQEVIKHTGEVVANYWEVDRVQDDDEQLLIEFDEDESDDEDESEVEGEQEGEDS